jgi:hypothetical protein
VFLLCDCVWDLHGLPPLAHTGIDPSQRPQAQAAVARGLLQSFDVGESFVKYF